MIEDEDEWPESERTFVGECDHCGKVRPVHRSVDHWFKEGLTDDGTVTSWCYPCYSKRADDV